MKTGIKIAVILLVLAGAVAGVTIMNRAPAPSGELIHEVERAVLPVETLVVQPETIAEKLRKTGVLQADKDVTLNAKVAGTVTRVLKHLGDTCKKGEIVAQLDRENYQIGVSQAGAAIKQAEVALEDAKRNLARMEKLVKSSVATEQQYDAARTGVDATKAALDQAKAAARSASKGLKDTSVKCPFDGRIAETMVEVGQSVGPAVPIVRIVDTSSLEMIVEVPSRQLARLELGQRVELSDPANPTRVVPAEVSRLGIAADARTRTFPVEIRTEVQDLLRPGQVVNAECELELHTDALLVPSTALNLENTEETRLMVVKEGIAKSIVVTLGPKIEDRFIVTSGLSPGDQVIVVGQDTLKDGAPVKPVASPK